METSEIEKLSFKNFNKIESDNKINELGSCPNFFNDKIYQILSDTVMKICISIDETNEPFKSKE